MPGYPRSIFKYSENLSEKTFLASSPQTLYELNNKLNSKISLSLDDTKILSGNLVQWYQAIQISSEKFENGKFNITCIILGCFGMFS